MITERTRERKKILWAVLASLLLHFVVAVSLAAFSKVSGPAIPEEEKPPELTFVNLATPPPANPAYIETDKSRETEEKPKEQTFESNANSIAASNASGATGNLPMPSQDGRDQPFMNFNTQQLSLPSEGEKAPPQQKPEASASVTPAETPKASATAAPSTTPETEQLAMLRPTPRTVPSPDEMVNSPTPEPSAAPSTPPPKPQRAASDFQAQREQTRITGSITNRGRSSVNAVGTPLAKYYKQACDAVGARWYALVKDKMDLVSIGTAHIAAEIDSQGHVQNLRLLSNNANEAFANVCLESFLDAKVPAIPPDVAAALPDGKMPIDINFTMYPN